MELQLLQPKPVELYPEAICAAFHLEKLIDKYQNILSKDPFVAGSLSELAHDLRKASLGDKKALDDLIKGGDATLDVATQLLKHDAIQEQNSEYESILAIKDRDKYAIDALELHNHLLDFKNGHFQKVLIYSKDLCIKTST